MSNVLEFANVAIIGASGAIGGACARRLAECYPAARVHAFARNAELHIDYSDEASIASAAEFAAQTGPLDLVLVATGVLHSANTLPEKSLRDLSADKFTHIFAANTITPALIAKHFLPRLNRERTAVFAAISARVGSISDNQLGGWYAYRASKAALNMVIKNAAIEMSRRNKKAIVVGLHPGTVDSSLSKPFQTNVAAGKLFTPEYSAQKLIQVLENLTPEHSGCCLAWDGEIIAP